MNKHFDIRGLALLGVFVVLARPLMGQGTSTKLLVVNGKTVAAAVLQINGQSYVTLDTVAQITNGSVSFQLNRIMLTIPESGATDMGGPPKLSKEFTKAALSELAQLREWKGAIETMIRFQGPVDGTWFQTYHDRAEEGFDLAKVAVSTDSDRDAVQLLENEFDNMAQWSSHAVAVRQALNATNTMSPTVLQDDPVLQKLSTCAQSLNAMLASDVSADIPACH